jgi:hypothetical protein
MAVSPELGLFTRSNGPGEAVKFGIGTRKKPGGVPGWIDHLADLRR